MPVYINIGTAVCIIHHSVCAISCPSVWQSRSVTQVHTHAFDKAVVHP